MISSTLKVKRSCCINQRCLWDVVKKRTTSKQQQRHYKKNRLLTIFNYHYKKKKKIYNNNEINNNNIKNNNDTKEHNKIGDIFLHSGTLLRCMLWLLVVFCISMQQLDCVEFSTIKTTTTISNLKRTNLLITTTTPTPTINNSNIAHNYHNGRNSMQDKTVGAIKRKYRRKLINNPTNQENILRYSIYKGKRRKHLTHPINRKYSNALSTPTPSPALIVITPTTPKITTTTTKTTWTSNFFMQQQQQMFLSTEHSKNTMPKSIMLQQQQQQQQQQQIMLSKQQPFIQHQQQQQHDITHVTKARKYLHVYELQQQQQQQQHQEQKNWMSPRRMNNATTVKGVHWQNQHEIIYQQLPRNLSYLQQQHQQQQQHHRNKEQHNKHTSTSVVHKSSSNRKDHVIAEGKTDIILYRNVVGPLPCPPGLLPHRIVPVYTHNNKYPTNQRHQGKL